MIPNQFINAIKIVHHHLEACNIDWSIVGSTNMALQGMDVEPHDLDVVVTLKDLEKMKEIFSEYNVSPIRELKPRSKEPGWAVSFRIADTEVEILAERELGEYMQELLAKNLKKIMVDGVTVPCFSLEAEVRVYAATQREQKAKRILDFLKR